MQGHASPGLIPFATIDSRPPQREHRVERGVPGCEQDQLRTLAFEERKTPGGRNGPPSDQSQVDVSIEETRIVRVRFEPITRHLRTFVHDPEAVTQRLAAIRRARVNSSA